MFVAGIVAVCVVWFTQYTWMPPCSLQDPCTPDALEVIVDSGLLTLPFLGFLDLRFAAVAAGAVDLAAAAHRGRYSVPVWLVGPLAVSALVILCAVLARLVRPEPPLHRPARRHYVRVGALLAVGVALIGVTVYRQAGADARTRAARIVPVTVTARTGDATIEVLQDDTVRRVSVQDSAAYPVGSLQRIALDDRGLHQLLSEPYDATPLLLPATFALLIGAGLVWRLREAGAAPRPARPRPPRVSVPGGWPELRAPGIILVLGAVVAGVATWERDLREVVQVVCGGDDCPALPMSLIGWGAIGVPLVLAAAIYTFARPGLLALWGLILATGMLAFGVAAMCFAEGAMEDPQNTFFDTYPGAFPALMGYDCALLALIVGSKFALALKDSPRLQRGDGPSALPLLVGAGAQLVVLPFTIWLGLWL